MRSRAPFFRRYFGHTVCSGLGRHAIRSVGLDENLFDSLALNKVVDIGAAESGGNRRWMALMGTLCAPALSQFTSTRYSTNLPCRSAECLQARVLSGLPINWLRLPSGPRALCRHGRSTRNRHPGITNSLTAEARRRNHGFVDRGELSHRTADNGIAFQVGPLSKIPIF